MVVVDHHHRIRVATNTVCTLVERSLADLHDAPLSRLFPRHRPPRIVLDAIDGSDRRRRIAEVLTTLTTRSGRTVRVVASVSELRPDPDGLTAVHLTPAHAMAPDHPDNLHRQLLQGFLDGDGHIEIARQAADIVAEREVFAGTSVARRTPDGHHSEIVAATGSLSDQVGRLLPISDPRWRRIWRSRTPVRLVGASADVVGPHDSSGADSLWLAPFEVDGRIDGVVTAIGHSRDRPSPGLTAFVGDVAEVTGLALDITERFEIRSMANLMADHERIARDLHDLVIGRVIATAMHLEAMLGQLDGDLRRRLDAAVDDLDIVAREIRSTVFQLHRSDGRRRLPDEIRTLTQRLADGYGLDSHCVITGTDDELPDTLRAAVLAVLRESLSNTGRHARARSVRVEVDFDDIVRLRVIDDGQGLDQAACSEQIATAAECRVDPDHLERIAMTAAPHCVAGESDPTIESLPATNGDVPARNNSERNGRDVDHLPTDDDLVDSIATATPEATNLERALSSTPRGRRGNGLANLRSRAQEFGGECYILPRRPRGTEVRWQVPHPRSNGATKPTII